MNVQKTIALVTAPVGLIFLVVDPSRLLDVITTFNLDWYQIFLPLAWGVILGALAGILRLDFVQKAFVAVVYLSTALFSFSLVGTLAIYLEHNAWFLTWPTLWLAALAVGLYGFMMMQLRFSDRYKAAQEKNKKGK